MFLEASHDICNFSQFISQKPFLIGSLLMFVKALVSFAVVDQ